MNKSITMSVEQTETYDADGSDAAELLAGLRPNSVHARIKSGWTMERALTTQKISPVERGRRGAMARWRAKATGGPS